MSFFMSADYSLSTKVMEIIYFIIGLLCIYCGVKNLKDKENPEPVGTFIFWAVLGVVLALGRWLPSLVSGILVVVMCIPAILKKVKKGAVSAATKAETEATYEKIGMKIFVPTLSIGMLAVICAISGMGIGLSALNGVALGVLVAIILLIFGTFMEGTAIAVLLVPVLWPIAESMGINVIHFGMILCISNVIGTMTPPVAVNIFSAVQVTRSVRELKIGEISKAEIPFLIGYVAVFFLCVFSETFCTFLIR